MLCARRGEDKAAACFSGSQKKRAAAARKCLACASTTTATSNAGTAAPLLAAVVPVAAAAGSGTDNGAADADDGNAQTTAPPPADGVAAAPLPVRVCSHAGCGKELAKMQMEELLFDTHENGEGHPAGCSEGSAKQMGLFADELEGEPCLEFITHKAKVWSLETVGGSEL